MSPAATTFPSPGHRRRLAGWSAAAALLLVPLAAMRFTDEVRWDAADFAVAAAMLAIAGGALELLLRGGGGGGAYRAGAGLAVVGCVLLVWTNLAVGVIGAADNRWNWLYAGLVALVAGGALIVQGRPAGMARTMLAAAAAQVAIGAAALVAGAGAEGAVWPRDVLGATALFTALWLGAAWLFARSARTRRAQTRR